MEKLTEGVAVWNISTFRGVFASKKELNAYRGEINNGDGAIVERHTKYRIIRQCYRWNGTAWIIMDGQEI